jgi:hypothetical protein
LYDLGAAVVSAGGVTVSAGRCFVTSENLKRAIADSVERGKADARWRARLRVFTRLAKTSK